MRPREESPSPAVTPPPGNPRFPLADAARGLLVSMVVIGHGVAYTGTYSDDFWGEPAIELSWVVLGFFMLSGFLLYRPFVGARADGKPRPSIPNYFRRRVLRIVPAYWLALTVLALTVGVDGMWENAPFFYSFTQIYENTLLLDGIDQAWSLAVEARCYLMLPIWAIIARRLTLGGSWLAGELAGIAFLVLLSEIPRVIGHIDPELIALNVEATGGFPYYGVPVFHGAFAIGMGMAAVSVAVERGTIGPRLTRTVAWVRAHPNLIWLAAFACYLLVAFVITGGIGTGAVSGADGSGEIDGIDDFVDFFANWWVAMACGFLYLVPALFGDEGGGTVRRFLALRVMGWIGVVSYGLYLWHSAALTEVNQRLGSLPTPFGDNVTLILVAYVLGLAAAAVSYYSVELYFLKKKERRV